MTLLRMIAPALALLVPLPAVAQDCGSGERPFDHGGGTACIPEVPERIVALNDQLLTLPLVEMGAPVIGSAGRVDAEGTPYLRGGMDTLGIDFANTDIAFVGTFNRLDVEAIAALEPDLILGGGYNDAATLDRLEALAPVLEIDNTGRGVLGTLEALADAAGRADGLSARKARYEANVARLAGYLGDTSEISVTLTFMFPEGEELWVYREGLGAMGQVVSDLGFDMPEAVRALEARQASFGAETIETLDADFVFGFYRQQPDATPAAVAAAYETFNPGWCQALSACRDGRFVLLPGPTFGSTMTSLELALELVEAHMAARPFATIEEGAE